MLKIVGIFFVIILIIIWLSTSFFSSSWLADKSRRLFFQATRPVVASGRFAWGMIAPTFDLLEVSRIREERDILRSQVADLQNMLLNAALFQEENAVLRADLNLHKSKSSQTVACDVLNYQVTSVAQNILLGCGKNAGVIAGLGVTSGGFLIATITEAGDTTSKAELLQSPKSTVDARSSGETVGVVKGSFGTGMVFGLVPTAAQVNIGDIVSTAGVSGRLAPGLLIGTIGVQISNTGDPEREYSVVPVRVWRGSKSVLVVLK